MGSTAQMHTQQHGAVQKSFTSIEAGSLSLCSLSCSEPARSDLEHGFGRILPKLGSELLPQLESKKLQYYLHRGAASMYSFPWPIPFPASSLAWCPFHLSSKPPSLQELYSCQGEKEG